MPAFLRQRISLTAASDRYEPLRFSSAERYAVWTAHREKCWLFGGGVSLGEMLEGTPRLAQVVTDLGRPENFNVNSYENWAQAHFGCNGDKSDVVFEPSPLIQAWLQKAAARAEKARESEARFQDRPYDWQGDTSAFARGDLNESQKSALAQLLGGGPLFRGQATSSRITSIRHAGPALWTLELASALLLTRKFGASTFPAIMRSRWTSIAAFADMKRSRAKCAFGTSINT